jgi:hypothetical protein
MRPRRAAAWVLPGGDQRLPGVVVADREQFNFLTGVRTGGMSFTTAWNMLVSATLAAVTTTVSSSPPSLTLAPP